MAERKDRLGALNRNDLINLASGAFAGSLTAIMTCPLDVLKTRLQSQSAVSTPMHLRYQSGNVFYGLGRIIGDEGVRGLYKGLAPTLLGYLPTWLVYFTTYDRYKAIVETQLELPSTHPTVHLFGAVCAGVTCSLATNPLWVIKTRLMTQDITQNHRYSGTFDAMRQIARQDGFRGFYRGIVPSLFGVFHVAVQFPIYEYLKVHLSSGNSVHPYSSYDKLSPNVHETPASTTTSILLASTISKLTASVATYPHEIIRTKIHNESIPPVKYTSVLRTITIIVEESGWRGMYAGLTANLFRTVPAAAVTLLGYEWCREHLSRYFLAAETV